MGLTQSLNTQRSTTSVSPAQRDVDRIDKCPKSISLNCDNRGLSTGSSLPSGREEADILLSAEHVHSARTRSVE